MRGDALRGERVPGPRHEGVGRALEHCAAHERRDGDDRRGRGLQRVAACPARRGSGRSRSRGSTGRSRSRRPARAPRAPRASARAASIPRSSTPSTGPAARSRIMNSWKRVPAARALRTCVRTGSSHIGSTRAATPSARRASSIASVSRAPSASRRARRRHSARSRSPRLNQTSSPSSRRPSITCEGVARQAPAALVDAVGEPERDEVGVGRDVAAVDLDVVARVRDHHQLVADLVEQAAGELRSARPAGEEDYHGRSVSPVSRMPGVRLVAGVDADQQRGQRLGDPRHLQPPGVHAAQARDQLDQRRRLRLVGARGRRTRARPRRASSSRSFRRGGVDRVQRGDDAHAVRRHLGRLLRRRSLPDAEHAGRLAGHGGGQRYGGVDEQLALAEVVLEVRQRLGLAAERHAQEHDLARLGRRAVGEPGHGAASGTCSRTRAAASSARAGVARADHDRDARSGQAQGEAGAERARAADHGDLVRHGGGGYTLRGHAAGGTDRARHRRRVGHRRGDGAAAGRRGRAGGGRPTSTRPSARSVAGEIDGARGAHGRRRRRVGAGRRRGGRGRARARRHRSSTTPAPTASRSSSTPTRRCGTSCSA